MAPQHNSRLRGFPGDDLFALLSPYSVVDYINVKSSFWLLIALDLEKTFIYLFFLQVQLDAPLV